MMKNDNMDNSSDFDHNREFAVILERINTNVEIIADGQIVLTRKVDVLYKEFGCQKEETTVIKIDVRFLKDDFRFLKDNVCFLKDDVRFLKDDVCFLKDGQTRLETGFKTLNNKFDVFAKDIKAIILNHDKRLLRLETTTLK